jgi:RND superfamily putative drug exporter
MSGLWPLLDKGVIMSRFLYRLARFSSTKRSAVIGIWLAIFLGLAVVAATGMDVSGGDFSIPGTESSDAMESLDRHFGGGSEDETETLQLVFQVSAGSVSDPATAELIQSAVASAGSIPDVLGVSDPISMISADGTVAVAEVSVGDLGDDAERMDAVTSGLESAVEPVRASGIVVELGGSIGDEEAGISVTEIAGAAIAFVVLVITFGSLTAAGVNMITALIGVIVGLTGVFAWSAVSPIEDSTMILAMMLGLAVGIDYSLFILSRFRDELRAGLSVEDAVPMAVGTAGSAVVFAGLTVVIALAGLTVVNIPPVTEMGLAAAGIVVVAVALSLTLMPIFLRLIGYRALSWFDRKPGADGTDERTGTPTPRLNLFQRWANAVTRFPRQALIASVALLAIVAIPFFMMETALDVPGGDDPDSSERRAYELIADEFGDGYQNPLVVLVEAPDAVSASSDVAIAISGLNHVAGVSEPQPNTDNTAAILTVLSTHGPNEDATSDLVKDIRSTADGFTDATVRVTGQTAIDIDINEKLNSALFVYISLIVGLAMVLLIVLFRSFLVPIVASLGFLLSLGASLGMTVAIFQWGWLGSVFGVEEGRPLMSIFPIIIVGILFGLAMDYQVFLVSRMHEAHVRGLSNRDAILDGFGRSASVVVAAATIMFAVFAGFAFSGLGIVAALAFALATGVLVDAFLVRMVIVPSALMLIGNASWWLPGWLDRVLPTIDTEGRTLHGAHSERGGKRGRTVDTAFSSADD